MRALDTAATGMAAMDLQVQVIAGNIANMSTTGFKSQRAEFQDLIYEHVQRIGAQASDQGNILPVGIELGSGVKTVGTPRLMTQGTLSQTGNTLDVAIQGVGWFKILMPDGTFSYTRDGSFQMDAQGRIVTAEGNVVQPTITMPPNSTGLTINHQGQVSVTPPGTTTSTILGQFTLTTFTNDAGLQANGNNLFTATPASGTPQDGLPATNGAGTLLQGSLEAIQRRGGDRNLEPDRRATRLRDELQGHHRGRRDAADDLAIDALRKVLAMIRARILTLGLLLALAAPLADPAAAQTRHAPALRANVTVTGDVVHIGDLIDNAGAVVRRADLPLARSRHPRRGGDRPHRRGDPAASAHRHRHPRPRPKSSSRARAAPSPRRRFRRASRRRWPASFGLGEARNITVNFDRDIAQSAGRAGRERRLASARPHLRSALARVST